MDRGLWIVGASAALAALGFGACFVLGTDAVALWTVTAQAVSGGAAGSGACLLDASGYVGTAAVMLPVLIEAKLLAVLGR